MARCRSSCFILIPSHGYRSILDLMPQKSPIAFPAPHCSLQAFADASIAVVKLLLSLLTFAAASLMCRLKVPNGLKQLLTSLASFQVAAVVDLMDYSTRRRRLGRLLWLGTLCTATTL